MAPKRKTDKLDTEVSSTRRTIVSDGYPMSVGELTNLYRDGELIIRPEFQRFFRWTETQKSRLIESILLGIPIPSIFVAQQESGKWELVDGLQRVATILELQGELKGPNGRKLPPLKLLKTKFLPGLEGRTWQNKGDEKKSLSSTLRLDIKRSKLDVKIIKRESSPETKFDLFQRLNSYGTVANAQELRSALLVAVSPEFFSWVEHLATHRSFKASVSLSDRLIEERYDLELVLRFLVLHNRPSKGLTQTALRDFPQFLDNEAIALAGNFSNRKDDLTATFQQTFDIVATNGGEDLFRRWDAKKETFAGPFLNTAYEVFALGIGFQLAQGDEPTPRIIQRAKEFWASTSSGYATGKSTEARMAEFIPIGRELMARSTQA